MHLYSFCATNITIFDHIVLACNAALDKSQLLLHNKLVLTFWEVNAQLITSSKVMNSSF